MSVCVCVVSICLSACLPVCLPVCLPACMYVCVCVCLKVVLFVSVYQCTMTTFTFMLDPLWVFPALPSTAYAFCRFEDPIGTGLGRLSSFRFSVEGYVVRFLSLFSMAQ